MSEKQKETSPKAESAKETPEKETVGGVKNTGADKSETKRSRTPIYVVTAIILISGIGSLAWWLYARQFVTTDDAKIAGYISVINPELATRITKIHVQENQPVKKGDLLIEFDSRQAEVKLEQAKAFLKKTLAGKDKAQSGVNLTRRTGKATINQAGSNLRTAENEIRQTELAADAKKSAVAEAETQVKIAEANYAQAQAQIPAAESALAQTKAQIPVLRNKLEVAKLEYERDKKLFDSGIVPKQKLDISGRELSIAQGELTSGEKEVEIAEARLNALRRQLNVESSRINEAKAKVSSAESAYRESLAQIDAVASQADESAGRLQEADTLPAKVAVEESEVGVAEAEIAQAEAAVKQAELELSYTKIYAPQDGVVAQRVVQEGQFVQPRQTLMTITQGDLWVIANFKETQIEKLKVGQKVNIYVDAYPNTVFRGRVESFQAGTGSQFNVLPAENASGNFVKVVQRVPVKIVFEEKPPEKYLLVPGMSVIPKVLVRE